MPDGSWIAANVREVLNYRASSLITSLPIRTGLDGFSVCPLTNRCPPLVLSVFENLGGSAEQGYLAPER